MDREQDFENRADRAAAAGDFGAARALLEDAVRSNDGSAGLWTKLSAMRKASGDLRGALAAVDRGLALNPLDFSSLL
jgi:tetratricopeptide (TPR) repeat protein